MSYSLIPTPINHQVYLIFEISGKMPVNVFLLEPQILETGVCPISTSVSLNLITSLRLENNSPAALST